MDITWTMSSGCDDDDDNDDKTLVVIPSSTWFQLPTTLKLCSYGPKRNGNLAQTVMTFGSQILAV